MSKDRRKEKKEEGVEAVAQHEPATTTEPEVSTSNAPATPVLHLHDEVIDFLAGLLVEEVTADGEVRS